MVEQDLEDLFRRRRADMVAFARMLTGSTAVAEELVQEAFLRMQGHGGIEQPDAYLRTTVANLARNHFRRLGVERKVAAAGRLVLEDPELDEMWALVCRLPLRQRTVLALRFYEDLTEHQIAETLGWPTGTVKSTLHRALGELRRRMS